MTYQDFQQHYEAHSDEMYHQLNRLTETELLELIADKAENKYHIWKGNDNYQVWRVLEKKGTSRSVQPLLGIVTDIKNEYLIRYHACTALFSIAKIKDEDIKGQVQFGLDKNRQPVDQQKAFEKLRSILDGHQHNGT